MLVGTRCGKRVWVLALLALWRVSGIVSESGRLHALLAGVSL